MIKYIFPSLFLLLSTISNGQSIDVDISAIGLILSGNDISGTSFVLNSKRQVVTCAHVIDTTKDIFYVPIGLTIIKHKLKLVIISYCQNTT